MAYFGFSYSDSCLPPTAGAGGGGRIGGDGRGRTGPSGGRSGAAPGGSWRARIIEYALSAPWPVPPATANSVRPACSAGQVPPDNEVLVGGERGVEREFGDGAERNYSYFTKEVPSRWGGNARCVAVRDLRLARTFTSP